MRFQPATLERIDRRDGGFVVRSCAAAPDCPRSLVHLLAEADGDHVLLAERDGAGWRRVTYAEARRAARGLGQALLDLGLGPRRPLLILSGNSIEHALLMLGAMWAGVSVAPVSPAYSLVSSDHAK